MALRLLSRSPLCRLPLLFRSVPSSFSSSTTSLLTKRFSSHQSTIIPVHVDKATKQVVRGMLTLEDLKRMVADGSVETVMCVFTDIYGRNMGKRFDAEFFLEDAVKNGTHVCNYLLACNMNMDPISGLKFANWEQGFGDVHLVPDFNSMRLASWQNKSVMVFCEVRDNKTHELVKVAPRSILQKQIDEAGKMAGYKILAASELEYFLFHSSFRHAADHQYEPRFLTSVSAHVEDYHTLQTSREEPFNAKARMALRNSGVPVETTKGEAGIGQHELNIKYSDVLTMSDRHQVYKQCLKEIADQMGWSVTFMAKPFHDNTGSGCHIHMSLWNGDKNAFTGDQKFGPVMCSDTFKHFLGGWIKHAPACMPFYAPTVNSYKRFVSSSWAPTRLVWSYDNRTAGFRVVGKGNSLRIECRIPGADANPYLAFAASLASGLDGIKNKIQPPDYFEGNIYEAQTMPQVPLSLREATKIFSESAFTKEAFGKDVVEHYTRFYNQEVDAFDKVVTDWERKRYFEQI